MGAFGARLCPEIVFANQVSYVHHAACLLPLLLLWITRAQSLLNIQRVNFFWYFWIREICQTQYVVYGKPRQNLPKHTYLSCRTFSPELIWNFAHYLFVRRVILSSSNRHRHLLWYGARFCSVWPEHIIAGGSSGTDNFNKDLSISINGLNLWKLLLLIKALLKTVLSL